MIDFKDVCNQGNSHGICRREDQLRSFDEKLDRAEVITNQNGYFPVKYFKPEGVEFFIICDRFVSFPYEE